MIAATPASNRLVDVIRASFGIDLGGARFNGLLDCLAKVDRDVERAAEVMLGVSRARLSEFVECTTNNETYFFRHAEQLDALGTMLGDVARERPKRLYRIWSAGCSSGEEALSLAIVARDALLAAPGAQVAVLGTDLSREALSKASGARYGEWSFRGVSQEARSRHFFADRSALRPVEALRSLVTYRRHNLLEGPPEPVPFDVVVCRNVLIYFGPEMLEIAVKVLVDAVAPGGLLLLGPAESPAVSLPPELEPVFFAGTMVFRRRSGVEHDSSESGSSVAPPWLPTSRPRPPTERPAPSVAPPPRAVRPAAEQHLLHAMVALESNDTDRAIAEIDLALRLDPGFAMAHYLQGSIHETLGQPAGAEAAFRRALAALVDLSPSDPVPGGGGMTVAEMARTLGAILESHRGGGA